MALTAAERDSGGGDGGGGREVCGVRRERPKRDEREEKTKELEERVDERDGT